MMALRCSSLAQHEGYAADTAPSTAASTSSSMFTEAKKPNHSRAQQVVYTRAVKCSTVGDSSSVPAGPTVVEGLA